MRNTYRNGTEAYYAASEFITASDALEDSKTAFGDAAAQACEVIDDLENQVEEAEAERDEFELELGKKEGASARKFLDILVKTRDVLIRGVEQYKVEFHVAEKNTTSGSGDFGDDIAESPGNEGNGQTPTKRVTGNRAS